MKISLIVAAGNNMGIGMNGDMPWHLPKDLKYFKQVTMKKPVIMGRKTFDSIGKALPGRLNLIVTRDTSWQAEGCVNCPNITYAIEMANSMLDVNDVDEIMIVGGGQIYDQALPLANKIYLTRVNKSPDSDTFFPNISSDWILKDKSETFVENDTEFNFEVYERN